MDSALLTAQRDRHHHRESHLRVRDLEQRVDNERQLDENYETTTRRFSSPASLTQVHAPRTARPTEPRDRTRSSSGIASSSRGRRRSDRPRSERRSGSFRFPPARVPTPSRSTSRSVPCRTSYPRRCRRRSRHDLDQRRSRRRQRHDHRGWRRRRRHLRDHGSRWCGRSPHPRPWWSR